MDDLLRKRIDRAIEGLTDEEARRVLDYIEFLQSKYGRRSRQPSALERIANSVEDTMRVGRVPYAAIKGTRDVLNTADRVVKGLTDAGRSVLDEIQTQLKAGSVEQEAARLPDKATEETGSSPNPIQDAPRVESPQDTS